MQFQAIDHPLVRHKLTLLRDEGTQPKDFRDLLLEISMLLGYAATQGLPLRSTSVQTPVGPAEGQLLAGRQPVIVPVLRAGLGMAEGLLRILPAAAVGHIGLARDPQTHQPVEYYRKLPADIRERHAIVVDPMLATGGSAAAAISIVKGAGACGVTLLCLVAAPEGVRVVDEQHPDVPIFGAALDEGLNDHAYIVPGLGDAGDRLYGTL
ncbi:MAG: uracil phosphoribosyltransferase [Thermaerobacter sp.]|nr:uracil phosphoribosyltransferase [Thermaerobacter sp.]